LNPASRYAWIVVVSITSLILYSPRDGLWTNIGEVRFDGGVVLSLWKSPETVTEDSHSHVSLDSDVSVPVKVVDIENKGFS
jgi:hypothetical protein